MKKEKGREKERKEERKARKTTLGLVRLNDRVLLFLLLVLKVAHQNMDSGDLAAVTWKIVTWQW